MEELVSCIITTYKRPKEIVKRAAKSVLNQTYKNIELIIVDDSPDTFANRNEVLDMAEALGERVTYIRHEKNQGACAARNTGVKNAKGEYVAFLDDDDEWHCEKIEKQMNILKESQEIALVYCGRYTCNQTTGESSIQKVKYYRGNVFERLFKNNFIGSTSFPLIRKSVLNELGGFDVNMKAAQDFELWLRIAQKYKVDYVDEPLVRYYVHDGEQISDDPSKKIEALCRINLIYEDYLKEHAKIASIRFVRLSEFYSRVDLKHAKKLLKMGFFKYPIPTIDLLRAIKHIYLKKR